MSESLKKGDVNLFAAMNNGITVIAKGLITTGTNVHLSDYQIVNGCQTSNVLQQNLSIPNIDELMLTVKIISSKDKEIRDKIIVGNNSQTEVKREQLVALLDTQKYIEDYYNAQNKYEKLYYERRSKQYRFDETQIPSYKVINSSILSASLATRGGMATSSPCGRYAFSSALLSLYLCSCPPQIPPK